MKIKRLIKHNLMRAAMTLALILACATPSTAFAQQSLPYSNGFESSDPLDGWTTFNSTTIMDYWAHASSHCLGFYSSTAVTYKKIALPQFEKPINALRLEFWTRPGDYTVSYFGNFDVGYMTDLSNDNTFVAVQTYAYNDWDGYSYTKKTVEFENAPDNAYIVMRQYNCFPSYEWLVDDVTVSEAPQFTVSDDGNTYTIWTAKGWGMFCDALLDNDTYNRFSGKTVKLGADISVSRMAGNDNHDFLGTFDGQHHTLTFTATATASYLAPFRNVLGNSDTDRAVIRDLNVVTNITAHDERHMAGLIAVVWGYVDVTNCNVTVDISSTKGSTNTDLYPAGIASQVVRDAQIAVSGCTVDGTISTDGKYAGGIIGIVQGSATITDCLSSVTIDSSTEGDGTHGGLVGLQYTYDGSTLTIEGCVFNGSLLGASTNCCGGFVGWRGKTINITNSLFAPTQVSINTTDGNVPCATFVRNGDSNTTITNCYYTDTLGTPQGEQAFSINNGVHVTDVLNYSGIANTYATSRLKFYNAGFIYNYDLPAAKLYAAAGEEGHIIIFTSISCADFSTIPENALSINENGHYILTMPSSNVTINAASSVVVSDFPWTENFNDLTDDATIPSCWNIMEIEGTFTNRWGYFTTAINGYGATNGTSYDGTNCVRYDSYNNFNGTTNYLKTVPLSLPASPEMQLSFWYKNPAGGDFSVYLSTDGGDTHTTALATGLTNQQEWTPYTISLGAYAGQEVVIVFKGTSNHNYNGDAYIYLDEVNVEDVLPCAKPTRLMATILGTQRVQLGWTKGDEDQTAWQICLDDDESNLIAAESNSYILDNLEILSTHTAKVRANCGGDGVSYWSNEVSFTMPLHDPVSYLDMNGDTLQCIDFTVLDGSETFPLAAGWYVVEHTLNYNQTLTVSGDVHLILKDNAVMNIGTAETPVSGNGFGEAGQYSFSIHIYGQSTGENNGQLNVYASQYGIWAYEGDFNCSSAKVTVSASNYGIWALAYNYASKGNINLKDATVTVNSTNDRAIYAQGGNLNIDGGKVSATGKNYVIYAYKQYYGGNLTISGGQVTSNGGTCGLYANGGNLTISGGQVTANGSDYGILADRGNLTISGGQVTANGSTYGLYAYGNITLGWTNASDFIYANSYYATGTLSIAEGKAFIDDEGTPHNSGTVNASDINGKTLYPYIQESVPYLDENGEQQLCTEYTVLTGTETSLAAGWYVADGMLNYNQTLILSGEVHLILKDNAVMNVGTAESPISGHGINGNSHSISIYAQSMGDSKGQLHVDANACGIFAQSGNVNICGGEVETTGYSGIQANNASVNIRGGQVTANGSNYGIYASSNNLTISGGQVTANGSTYGIYGNNITLGWTNASDFIYVSSYYASGTLSIAEGKVFKDVDETPYESGPVDASEINGKWLYPSVASIYTKGIEAHGTDESPSGWYLIASPLAGETNAEAVAHLINTTNPENFDLYRFNPSNEGSEWVNYKADNFSLVNGHGYLYASNDTKVLCFAGSFITDTESVAVGLAYDASDDHKCWNLVGNPFPCEATINKPYYMLNADGATINPEAIVGGTIPPCTAVFVKGESSDDTVVFSKVSAPASNAPIGAIDGLFSVSADKQVYFSKGNLQYQPSTASWRFAPNQYDLLITPEDLNLYHSAVGNYADVTFLYTENYTDWIDFFGWGTSGWKSGANAYMPYSASYMSDDYLPDGDGNNDLTGTYANADWAWYNPISNGGNAANQWRTLTHDEWAYLFSGRDGATSKYGHGSVNGVNGMIILPDNWTLPDGCSFTPGNSDWTNSYTTTEWAAMEAAGAVFLPAAGQRSFGTFVNNVGNLGRYWSSTHRNNTAAYDVWFHSDFISELDTQAYSNRSMGYSVRPVQDAQ